MKVHLLKSGRNKETRNTPMEVCACRIMNRKHQHVRFFLASALNQERTRSPELWLAVFLLPRLHIDIAPIYSITVLRRSNQIYGSCDRLSRGLIIFCYQSALSPGPLQEHRIAPKCQLFGNQQQQSSV